jgi:hypothetical protein
MRKVVKFIYSVSLGGIMSNGTKNRVIKVLRAAMMVGGTGALLMLVFSVGKLLLEILNTGFPDMDTLCAKLLWIAILFLTGWVVSLIGIRLLNNLVLPLIICGFIWLTLFGILAIYMLTICRLYTETFSPVCCLYHSLLFATGFAVLVGLHLLIEDYDLRPYSIPILVMVLIHFFVAVSHYVVLKGHLACAINDAICLSVMLFICILMALHLGLLNPLRRTVDRLVQRTK